MSIQRTVGEVMTHMPLTTVGRALSAGEAAGVAEQRGVRHLFVTNGEQVVGIVCTCDLIGRPGLAVEDCMAHTVITVDAACSLPDAAGVMAREHIGCLAVFDDDALAGVITRGDLRRAGVAESDLGATRCASCGSTHGVRPHPRMPDVEFCLSCLAEATTPMDYH